MRLCFPFVFPVSVGHFKEKRPGKRPKRRDNSWSSCDRAVVRSCGRAVVRSCARAVVRSCTRKREQMARANRLVWFITTTRSIVEKHRIQLPPAISTKTARNDHGNAAMARTCGAASADMTPPFLRRRLERFCSKKCKHRLQTRFRQKPGVPCFYAGRGSIEVHWRSISPV